MLNDNLQDYEARKIAIENNKQNIIVEAGAGTGKTTLLVKKMMFLILVEEVKLSRIVALTFTKKAAASLKQRLEESLHNAYHSFSKYPFILSDKTNFTEKINKLPQQEQNTLTELRTLFIKAGSNPDTIRKRLKTAFEEIALCQIGTIHSFCFFILKKYALEAGLNTEMDIDEGAITNILFDKYWASFLDEELNLTSPNNKIWLEILKEVSLKDLKDFAHNLCTPRFEDYNPINNYAAIKKQANKIISEAENLLKTHPTKVALTEALQKVIVSLKQDIDFWDNKQTAEQESTFIKSFPSTLKDWTKEELHAAKDIVNFAKNILIKKQQLLLRTYRLLLPFAQRVKAEILKQNYITYDEIIFKTHNLILKNKEVRQELKLSYDNIFIDEFQDTDPIQGEIMLFLAETLDTFAANWQDLKLCAGKLFIVGDPKQSIYHFRGADIAAYQKFCDLMKEQGAQVCVLRQNFRSAEKIIDYVNAFGENQIKEKENLQTAYQKIYPTKTFDKARVELYLYDLEEKINREESLPMFAQSTAKWICDNVKKAVKSDGTLLAYKDIAILMPTAKQINIFLKALKENNIPYNVEKDENFYSSQEISDLINILKVLKNPKDQTALLGVLRSAVGLIPDDELVHIAKEYKLNIYAEVQNNKLRTVYEKLKYLREQTNTLNPVQLINEVLEIFNFTSYQALASVNEQTLANITKFKQVAATLFENGAYTLEQLLDNLETYQKEESKESSAILAEENFNVVKILTIHKAKGLEYPVVILTDLSRSLSNNGPIDKWQDKALYSRSLNLKGLMLGDIKDGAFSIISNENKEKELEEKRRLLYVAMTRAKEILVIIDDLNSKTGTFSIFLKEAKCLPSQNREKTIMSADVFYQNTPLPQDIFYTENNALKESFNFNFPEWKESFGNREKEYKTYLKNEQNLSAGTATIFKTPAVEHAITVGSLCHKILQNIFSKTPSSLEYETDKEALKEAQTIVSDFCKTSAFEELKNMECLATELPFTVLENGVVKNGIVDALFKTKDGKFTLIDFKSDKIEVVNAKTVEPKYLEQLAFYKNALSKVFQGKIETSLVYLRPAKIYKIEE